VTEKRVEAFRPTSGRVVGVLGLLIVLVILVLGVREGFPLWMIGLVVTAGVLIWSALLRPGVRIVGDELVLRNMFLTHAVPLAAVEEVAVGRVLVVRAGDRKLISPAIGRSLNQVVRPRKAVRGGPDSGRDLVKLAGSSYPDFVVERIRLAASDHRAQPGIRAMSQDQQDLTEQVRRSPAIPEIAALVASLAVLALGIVLAL
jgi:hypothetical protein